MKENKLIKMILLFLLDGEKPRHQVTSKIKNYPKETQAKAIGNIMSNGLVRLRVERCSGVGRTPCFISLTEKGLDKAIGYSDGPEHESIWNLKQA